jgi:hypothetical protein
MKKMREIEKETLENPAFNRNWWNLIPLYTKLDTLNTPSMRSRDMNIRIIKPECPYIGCEFTFSNKVKLGKEYDSCWNGKVN